MSAKNNRVGEVSFNKFGSKMTIIEYNNAQDMTIVFDDDQYIVKCKYGDFKRGLIRNVYDKSVYNTGYLGEGEYKTSINGVKTVEYKIWLDMLRRCYDSNYKKKLPTYSDCEVYEGWHNFQNFCKWYSENYYEIDDEMMALDKDILIKGSKVYSPDTCVFVPQSMNTLFIKGDKSRGSLPIGVTLYKRTNKYMAQCNDRLGNTAYLGYHNTPEEAFYAYKTYKEKVIKEVAEQYKNKIPSKLYDALVSYEVEIDD